MTTLQIGIASLRHRWLRTVVGLASVGLALAMLSVSLSATKRVRDALGSFDETSLMIKAFRDETLPYSFVNEIRSLGGGAGDVQWNTFLDAEDKNKQVSFTVIGATDDYFSQYPAVTLKWSPGAKERWLDDKQGVVVAEDLLERMGWSVGSTVFLPMRFGPLPAHVVGTSTGGISFVAFVHYDYVDQARPDRGQVVFILLPRNQDPDATAKKIRDHFASVDPPIMVTRERSFHEFIMSISGALPAVLEKIAAVFGLCTMLLIFSNSMVSLKERRGEFGALRAIGFTRARVLAVIIGESVVLCAIAGVLGCGVPYLVFHAEGLHLGQLALANVRVDGVICLSLLAASMFAGGLATLAPALIVAFTPPVELLQR